jgi:hypothetical protein
MRASAASGTGVWAQTTSTTAAKDSTAGNASNAKATPLTLKTPKDRHSYALGMTLGQSIVKQQADVDALIVGQGLKDGMSGKSDSTLVLKTEKDKRSYALGMSYGQGLAKQQVDVDPAIVARGMRDEVSELSRK